MNLHPLTDLLKNLLAKGTVKLSIPGTSGWGTGFLITHDLVLTCAHVVKKEGISVSVYWKQQEECIKATVEKLVPHPIDLALLRLSEPVDKAIYVYLDIDQSSLPQAEHAYLFGYPDKEYYDGCPVQITCEGFLGGNFPLIKFKSGQVRPGMSGSPILNLTTGKVFGIVKDTRDRSSDLGGDGISAAIILQHFPELTDLLDLTYKKPSLWRAALKLPGYVQIAKELIFKSYAESGCINAECYEFLLNLRATCGELSEIETKEIEKDLFELCKNLHKKIDDILPTFEQEIFGFFQSVTDFESALPKLRSRLKKLGISLGLNPEKIEEISSLSLCQYINRELLPLNTEKAILIYKESIKANPNFEEFHIGLGISLSKKKNFKGAENAFLEAKKIVSQKEHYSTNDLENLKSLIQKTRNNHRNRLFARISPFLKLALILAIVFIFMKASFIKKIVLIVALLLFSEVLIKILRFSRRLPKNNTSR